MIGPAEINMKLPDGGLGGGRGCCKPPQRGPGQSPGSQTHFSKNIMQICFYCITSEDWRGRADGHLIAKCWLRVLVLVDGTATPTGCCRTVALLYTPKSYCVVFPVKKQLRPARLLVRPKPDQPDRLLRPCSMIH